MEEESRKMETLVAYREMRGREGILTSSIALCYDAVSMEFIDLHLLENFHLVL